MAILKFVRLFDTGQEQAEVIDCKHYGVVALSGDFDAPPVLRRVDADSEAPRASPQPSHKAAG
ncbi:hypothetical protein HLV40_15360 [Chromohalobacter salexigens]|nr:hypothetical protein [Chromohalobacter salexigens]